MNRFLKVIDGISEFTGKAGSLLVVVLVVAVTYDITVRYLFVKANQWAYDTTYMLYGMYTMLGVAYCHRHHGHVRMDLIYSRLSPRGKAITDVICYLLLFFPLMTILLYKCGQNAWWSITHGECSSSSVWRPYLGPFKGIITFGFFLFYLQGIAEFIRSCKIAFTGEGYES